ncbi:unnamed protein product, partial [Gulo gulo]
LRSCCGVSHARPRPRASETQAAGWAARRGRAPRSLGTDPELAGDRGSPGPGECEQGCRFTMIW